MSQLIYPAVLLIFCRGLPLAGSELHGNLYFFMFCKPGSFFINALSLTNTLYFGMKNKLSLGFSDTKKKKLKPNRVIDPCGYRHWPLFRHFFAFVPLPFLHIPEESGIIRRFLNPKNRLWCIPCLFIIVPAQEREQSISLGMKRVWLILWCRLVQTISSLRSYIFFSLGEGG